jgi:hypothetical protein
MPFLTVNGLAASVAEDSMKETPRDIGSTETAFDGTLRKSRQSTKTDLEYETPPMSSADALAWRGLLTGKGEVWSFDSSLYGSKGLGPSASTAATVSAAQSKFGGSSLRLVGTTGTITYPVSIPVAFTVMYWNKINAAAWKHSIFASDGSSFENGIQGVFTHPLLTVSVASTVVLAETNAWTSYVDDLVVFPFVIPPSWAAVFGVAATAFPSLPKLTLGGDIIQESSRTVLGDVSGTKPLRGILNGVNAVTHRTMSVSLREV